MKLGRSVVDPADPQPCRHMRNLVSSLADGSAGGVVQWYTRLHVNGCSSCHAALQAYTAVISRLKRFELTGSQHQDMSLTSERRAEMEFALDRIEHKMKDAQ